MKYIHYLIILLCLSHIPIIRANQQTFSVIQFDSSDGLSSPVAFSIIKDHYGFIWASTRRGIDRFDGLHFKSYTLTESDMRMADDGIRYDLLKNNDDEMDMTRVLAKTYLSPSSFNLKKMKDKYLEATSRNKQGWDKEPKRLYIQ